MNPGQSDDNIVLRNSGHKRKRKKKKINKRAIIVTICLLGTVIGCIAFGMYYYSRSLLNQVERGELDESDLGIKEEVKEEIEGTPINKIVNIALFGIDGTFDDSVQHSDSTMIATFDPVHKKLKVTSIMRDTYIDIPGYGKDKFTHAFSYGGPQLTIKTLNQNFDLNITDYVSIDFNEMQKVVDSFGGIDVEMSDEEFNSLSHYCAITDDAENLSSDEPIKLNADGTYHLNGFQALGYTRIRDIGRSDFDRTERQRKFLSIMFKKISDAGKGELASMAIKLLPSIKTSMTDKEIMNLAINILNLGTKNLESERFPRDEYCNDDNAPDNGMYILSYDEEYTSEQLSKYIFEDKKLWEEDNQKIYVERRYGIPVGYSAGNSTIYNSDGSSDNNGNNIWTNNSNDSYNSQEQNQYNGYSGNTQNYDDNSSNSDDDSDTNNYYNGNNSGLYDEDTTLQNENGQDGQDTQNP